MSRCFPFPPPGYEKKPTTDDLDLLKKEKRKEKKHKKDKKDKEKKEGKEKREKDRSESKHKDKKDKKDKHRDKKKDKEKGKTSTQDEGYNGEKHNEQMQQIQDKKHSLQFRNGESNKDRTNSSDDKKQQSTQFQGQNGDLARNRDTENIKFVQELDRRIRDEEKGSGSHQFFNEGRKSSYNNKIEMQNAMARSKINGATPPPPPPSQPPLPPPPQPPLDHKIERRFDQKEKVQESDDRRGDKRKHKDRDKQRAGKEKDNEKEKKEKSKEKNEREREKNKHMKKSDSPMATLNNLSSHILENSFHEGILKKRKEMETNGVSHENEPRPNKMARPISNISPENGRPQNQNPSSSFLDNQRERERSSSQNNFKMGGGKSQKVNGIIPPPSPPLSASLPAKKPPIPAFNHLHHKPSPIKSPPPPVITNTNHVTAQSPPVTATKPPPPPPPIPIPIPVPAKQPVSRPKPPPVVKAAAAPPPPPPKKKAETVKPPHPDTKYLNQILTVPKPDEWGGVDDQEWLFSTSAPPPLPPREAATMADVQVWSEAKHIESVDVCALPYVIPY
ncbi:hypothetical protein Lser_V15G02721 [Lactuca serriola]